MSARTIIGTALMLIGAAFLVPVAIGVTDLWTTVMFGHAWSWFNWPEQGRDISVAAYVGFIIGCVGAAVRWLPV